MTKKIVLDLDDTLNSLTMHILNKLGCGVGPFDYDTFPVECGYDIIAAWSKLTGRSKVEVPIFWEWISRSIWESAPRSPQFNMVMNQVYSKFPPENILIATSPTKSADCLFAKYNWIEKHLTQKLHRQYSITPRKSWLAQEGVVLIDDCDKNIDDFRELGGEGILVPRPWNSLHKIGISTEETNKYLQTKILLI